MSGKPRVDTTEWLERVQLAEEYWAEKIRKTDEIVRMYRCQSEFATSTTYSGLDTPEVNKVWEYISSVMPQIFYKAPHAFVRPMKPGNQTKAEACEAVLNHDVKRVNFTKHGRRIALDALLRGWGVAKVAYMPPSIAYAITPTSKKDEEALATTQNQRRPSDNDTSGRVLFFHVPVRQFIWDPNASDLEDASWCCHITYELLDSVKSNKRYANTEDLGASALKGKLDTKYPTTTMSMLEPEDQRWLTEQQEDYVKLYEIWIRDGDSARRMLVIADTGASDNKWLRWEDWPFTRMDDYPFAVLSFMPDPEGRVPGMSDVRPWINLQQNMNAMLDRMVRFVDGMRSKYLCDAAVADDVRKALEQAEDRAVIPIEMDRLEVGPNRRNLSDLVVPVQHAQLPPEIWAVWRQLEGLVNQVSGHTPYGMSEAKSAGTATEAGILERTSTLRIEDKLANGVAEWAVTVFGKMLAVIQEFYDAGEVPVLTPAGAEEFRRFQREDLDIEAAVSIDFGTMGRISSDQQKSRDLLLLIGQLGPLLAQGQGVPAALRELIRRVFEAYHIVDADALLPFTSPPVNPSDENTRMLLGEFVEVNPMDDHMLHFHTHAVALKQAIAKGMNGPAELLQAHVMKHSDAMEQAQEGGRMNGIAASPSANPAADGAPVPSPTGNGQMLGIQMPGGLR